MYILISRNYTLPPGRSWENACQSNRGKRWANTTCPASCTAKSLFFSKETYYMNILTQWSKQSSIEFLFWFINIIGWHIHFVHISVALLLSEVHPYPQAIVYLAHQRCLVAGFWNVLFSPATRNELHIFEIQENLETLRMIVAKLHEKSLNNTLVQFTWKQ